MPRVKLSALKCLASAAPTCENGRGRLRPDSRRLAEDERFTGSEGDRGKPQNWKLYLTPSWGSSESFRKKDHKLQLGGGFLPHTGSHSLTSGHACRPLSCSHNQRIDPRAPEVAAR